MAEGNDTHDSSWAAIMTCVAFSLAEMDYSPPDARTTDMFLSRMEELLRSPEMLDTLSVEDFLAASDLVQTLRRQVHERSEAIRSDHGDPPW